MLLMQTQLHGSRWSHVTRGRQQLALSLQAAKAWRLDGEVRV
jgi:uncharacterized protein (DUF849 family)